MENVEFPKDTEKIKEFLSDTKTYSIDNIDLFAKQQDQINNYSISNKMLLFAQTHGQATIVKSFKKWKEEINEETGENIRVKKGEKALTIFVPVTTSTFNSANGDMKSLKSATKKEKMDIQNGKIKVRTKTKTVPAGKVFDISQTDAPDNYHEKFIKSKLNEDQNIIFDALHLTLQDEQIELKSSNVLVNALGSASVDNFDSKRIKLHSNIAPDFAINIMIHELAHHKLHFNTTENDSIIDDIREIEAETIAYFVSSEFGMESDHSKAYVQNFLRSIDNNDKFTDILNRCCNTKREIVSEIRNNIGKLQNFDISNNDILEELNSTSKELKNEKSCDNIYSEKSEIKNIDTYGINF